MPPARRFAILTCMDARLDPAKFAGLAEGDAHVIRNAGGRAKMPSARWGFPISCLERKNGL
jgi:carbonic anhydrase